MQRKWLVLIAVSLMFFFVTGATFTSMGVVLYSMIGDLHWSQTAAGTAFSILGMACCLSSPLPSLMMIRIGTRWTLCIGGVLLSSGFLCASLTQGLALFYVGTALMGVGFSLGANIPGVYLLASWFPRSSSIIGLYLMFGAFGGVVAPPVVRWIASSGAEGWRTHWLVMAIVAAGVGLVCLVVVRDHAADGGDGNAGVQPIVMTAQDWNYKAAIFKPQFLIVATAMVVTQACVTTLNGAGVLHLTKLGNSANFATYMLSLQALMATLAKGASGALSDLMPPKLLLGVGLLIQCAGMLLLAHSTDSALGYAFAMTFGIGWGTAYLAVTVILIKYFGPNTGSALLSTVWLSTIFAAAAPAVAGIVADRTGSYAAVFTMGGLLFLPIAVAVFSMRTPIKVGRV